MSKIISTDYKESYKRCRKHRVFKVEFKLKEKTERCSAAQGRECQNRRGLDKAVMELGKRR